MPAAVAAAAAAASAGAVLLCLLLNCRPQPALDAQRESERGEDEASPLLSGSGPGSDREEEEEEPWPDRAPVTCCEATAVAARTARRTWELTVGRWGLHGLAFGIKRHMKRQVSWIHPFALPLMFALPRTLGVSTVTFSASHALVSSSFALLCYYGSKHGMI
jgi:hypothetical protein